MLEAKSRITGHYMLEANPNKNDEHPPPLNAPILIECQALKILSAPQQKKNAEAYSTMAKQP